MRQILPSMSSPSQSSLLVKSAAVAAVAVSVWVAYVEFHRRSKLQQNGEATAGDTTKSSSSSSNKTSNGAATGWFGDTAAKQTDKDAKEEGAPPVREIVGMIKSNGTRGVSDPAEPNLVRVLSRGTITIVHGSVTGTCSKLASQLANSLREAVTTTPTRSTPVTTTQNQYRIVQVASIQDLDWWDELLNDDDSETGNDATLSSSSSRPPPPPALVIVLLSTYTNGAWPPSTESLSNALQDLLTDWRIAKFPLKHKLQVAVFGTGSSEYRTSNNNSDGEDNDTMGQPAKEALSQFQRLGAKCIVSLGLGDDAVGDHIQQAFEQWQQSIVHHVRGCCGGDSSGSNGVCCQSSDKNCSSNGKVDTLQLADVEEEDEYEYESDDDREPEVMDLEDMGDSIMASSRRSNTQEADSGPREMVTPSQAAALKKEGYRLIGSHSAVKLCRWTKHQLRGRGGCYKHTFYGITSYQCMEATPSLACANKCVFCWRHHKNPVGKEWRWKTDDPHYIVDQAVQTHVQMIKEARGIPGVQLDRWKEALTVRHCALSLVGEPIMYPRIDELLHDLHSRKISTFLVTNGQHPQAIGNLRPITQLYVSVDAPTKESLIAIDRPLFHDAWERLKQSLSSLKDKGQRTVARLTVVKGWNSDEIAGYAQLIALGSVSLVEVKGVTFCGKSDASNLNMTNTPWHHEVVELTQTLKLEIDKLRVKADSNDAIPEYGLACEHKHSCSVLLARVDQFAVDDPVTGQRQWKTWIDYDKFHALAARHAIDSNFHFTVEDYTADTPEWALFGSEHEGFDPTDTRHRKKSKHPKYVQFDESGVPTHDHNNHPLTDIERERLRYQMEERKRQIGSGSVVTELRDGAKEVFDASLMFRGLVVTK